MVKVSKVSFSKYDAMFLILKPTIKKIIKGEVKKMKKMLSMLLIIVMVLMMGTACSKGEDNNGKETSGNEASNGAETQESVDSTITEFGEYTADNPYHLVFAYIEFYEQDDAAREEVQEAINAKMIPEYHMEVELLSLSYADYSTTIQLMLAGGDELDVMPVYYPYASSWISMGGVYDMAPLMETEDGQKIIEALGEANAHVGNMNGILYGFPANKESVELGGLCFRADIADELGFTEKYGLELNKDEYDGTIYDWTVAEEILAAVQESYPSMTPLYMNNTEQLPRFVFFDELVDGFGVLDWEADHSSVEVVNKFETETYKNAVTRLADWYDKGYIFKDAATDTQGSATMMKADNTFSFLSAIKPGFLAEQESAVGMPLYTMYFGDHVEGGISTTNVSFFNTSIATNSIDPEMAFKFVSALYADAELYNLWQYGIEGTHYEVQEDGTAYYVEGVDGSNAPYHQNSGWFMGNQFQSYVWNDGSKDSGYWDKLNAHNNWAEYTAGFGFMWDSTEYMSQITALNNALETYRAALSTGSVGTHDVDEIIQQLNDALYAAGLEEVMKAKQEQLDAWLTTQ